MAGEQSGGGPVGEASGAGSSGLTGGLSGGEWWQPDAPGQPLGGTAEEPADDGVYVARPEAPARPSAPPPSGAGRAFTAADFPGWDAVTIDFPLEDEPEDADGTAEGAKQLIPGQRTGAAAEQAEAEDGADQDPGPPSPGALPPGRPPPVAVAAAGRRGAGRRGGDRAVPGAADRLGSGLPVQGAAGLHQEVRRLRHPADHHEHLDALVLGPHPGELGHTAGLGLADDARGHAGGPAVLRIAAVGTALFVTAITMRRRKA
ncbi:hypothetical protein E6W39_18600 [Kitasatospora acidiphila]|uniref:Uncharacterized protein n=1 Tax=Kitasatospora acidiphila TaxID=2567942 RepID=A0A540W4A9_9ACTN|nr:hypothetical protein [Kitasatospora acidiphila]TQF03869.1 hypothetical protein E6W39_18600 [Kitasatospora acidiphila]